MNYSSWLRRVQRRLSIAFTLTVIANFVARAQGSGEPPAPGDLRTTAGTGPFAVDGLYLFALPYLGHRHERRAAA